MSHSYDDVQAVLPTLMKMTIQTQKLRQLQMIEVLVIWVE